MQEQGIAATSVTLTLDPTNDTPAVLEFYAKRFHADADWWFLTGDSEAAMHELVRKGFLQTVENVPEGKGEDPLIHSTRVLLFDGDGGLRGIYDGVDPQSNEMILRDIRSLSKGQSGA